MAFRAFSFISAASAKTLPAPCIFCRVSREFTTSSTFSLVPVKLFPRRSNPREDGLAPASESSSVACHSWNWTPLGPLDRPRSRKPASSPESTERSDVEILLEWELVCVHLLSASSGNLFSKKPTTCREAPRFGEPPLEKRQGGGEARADWGKAGGGVMSTVGGSQSLSPEALRRSRGAEAATPVSSRSCSTSAAQPRRSAAREMSWPRRSCASV
mmetsp:Transcript_106238/g.310574  ORF Transcript_106238/g.310574 Transcript_106238/m.310574 type:complete len:215 (+) Transcript_106238:1734-2378(+)